MSSLPSFLPPLLNLDGEWEEILNKLYRVFEKDFVKRKLFYKNSQVKYDNRKNSSNKEEAFWHLITKKDKELGYRIPDYDRAKRLTWVRPIIENHDNSEIKDFNYLEGSGEIRKYLWLYNYDFVVILEIKRNKKYIYVVTDFYIYYNHSRRKLERKYQQRIKDCIQKTTTA